MEGFEILKLEALVGKSIKDISASSNENSINVLLKEGELYAVNLQEKTVTPVIDNASFQTDFNDFET